MPPKSKDTTVKKIAPQINRPPISDTSLFRIPENAVEGFQERIETGIEWTLIELAARHHKKTALSDVPSISFSEALQDKLNKSILSGFLHEHSSLTLEQQSELLLPITLWDVEKFANEEGKICFENNNCITDDLVKMIKRAVRLGDREVLKNDLENISVLRINDSKVCAGYAKTTLMRLPKVRWLDCRQVLATDRQLETFEPHPDDLRAAYFFFTIFRIMGIPPPPKPEKGATTTFHVELELPLLDATRRTHLMYHNYESLIEMLPPPEDGDWPVKDPSTFIESRTLVGNNC